MELTTVKGRSGAPQSFPVRQSRWQADLSCHEGKSGKNRSPASIAMAYLLGREPVVRMAKI